MITEIWDQKYTHVFDLTWKRSLYVDLILELTLLESSQVPFTEVLDLVRGRRVFLSRGFAYVPKDDMIVILITHYRAHLSQQLAVSNIFCI